MTERDAFEVLLGRIRQHGRFVRADAHDFDVVSLVHAADRLDGVEDDVPEREPEVANQELGPSPSTPLRTEADYVGVERGRQRRQPRSDRALNPLLQISEFTGTARDKGVDSILEDFGDVVGPKRP
jgi:hypothetical protein